MPPSFPKEVAPPLKLILESVKRVLRAEHKSLLAKFKASPLRASGCTCVVTLREPWALKLVLCRRHVDEKRNSSDERVWRFKEEGLFIPPSPTWAAEVTACSVPCVEVFMSAGEHNPAFLLVERHIQLVLWAGFEFRKLYKGTRWRAALKAAMSNDEVRAALLAIDALSPHGLNLSKAVYAFVHERWPTAQFAEYRTRPSYSDNTPSDEVDGG